MAQTGYTPILIYSSSTGGNAPAAGSLTNSTLGSELAINITDGKLFYKDNANAVQVIGWKTVPTTAGGTGLTSYTAGDLLYYASGTTLSKLAIGTSGQWLGSSGSAPQWNSPAALTKTDDTNVTLTLGGSASTALLNAASLTLGWTGQLAVTRGGTGLSTVAQGDILYGSAANTLSALAKNTTATRYLSNTGTSNNPAWAQIDLTNGVTGTLPTTNGGTGLTSFTANGLVYASSTSALATGSALAWDGANILTLFRSTGTDSLEPTVKFSNTLFAGQNAAVVKTANGGLALDIQSPSTSTFQNRSRLYMNGGSGNVINVQTSTDNGSTWATPWSFNASNIVQGTASKGINFTANSAAAGMTSQLLNYYEEGTFTPTVGGTWTTNPTSLNGTYTRIGRVVNITFTFTGGAKSSATAGWIDSMPFNISVSGTGAVVDSNIGNYGLALAANTTRVWLTANAFGAGTNYVTVMYMV